MSRDPVAALNHDPRPLPTVSIQPDSTNDWPRDNPEPFDDMERPETPPNPAQALPPESRQNFLDASTLVIVQDVMHTSDISQSNNSERDDMALHPASSVSLQGEWLPRWRFSELIFRTICSRRSSYAVPVSQSSETSTSTESENQESLALRAKYHKSSLCRKIRQSPNHALYRSPLRVLISSTPCLGMSVYLFRTIIVLIFISHSVASAASPFSCSLDRHLTSGLSLTGMQSTPSPVSDQCLSHTYGLY